MAANTIKPPIQGGAPPAPPTDLPAFNADEGPMRAELRRQIAALERELAGVIARSCPWEPRTVNTQRGPAVMSGAHLEQIRDELLASLHDLCRRIQGAVDEQHAAQQLEAQQADDADASGGWRRLTRR